MKVPISSPDRFRQDQKGLSPVERIQFMSSISSFYIHTLPTCRTIRSNPAYLNFKLADSPRSLSVACGHFFADKGEEEKGRLSLTTKEFSWQDSSNRLDTTLLTLEVVIQNEESKGRREGENCEEGRTSFQVVNRPSRLELLQPHGFVGVTKGEFSRFILGYHILDGFDRPSFLGRLGNDLPFFLELSKSALLSARLG